MRFCWGGGMLAKALWFLFENTVSIWYTCKMTHEDLPTTVIELIIIVRLVSNLNVSNETLINNYYMNLSSLCHHYAFNCSFCPNLSLSPLLLSLLILEIMSRCLKNYFFSTVILRFAYKTFCTHTVVYVYCRLV